MDTQKGPEATELSASEVLETLEQKICSTVIKQLEQPLAKAVHDAIATACKPPRRAAKGKCAQIWDTLDKQIAKGAEPSLQDVHRIARRRHWNANTARIQYYKWRHAHAVA